ncbi:hypothetical protein IWX91DRAFT_345388 [Phyllosticta citricarpa]
MLRATAATTNVYCQDTLFVWWIVAFADCQSALLSTAPSKIVTSSNPRLSNQSQVSVSLRTSHLTRATSVSQ